MTKKRNDSRGRRQPEIVPLREHKRITLCCPHCGEFSLMAIKKKARINGEVNYYVVCSNCGHDFQQVGQPYNFWRDVKRKYKLDAAQLRSMQSEVVKGLLNTGEIPLKETGNVIQTGKITFIKPKQRNKKK